MYLQHWTLDQPLVTLLPFYPPQSLEYFSAVSFYGITFFRFYM
jgi:hypothetical protein